MSERHSHVVTAEEVQKAGKFILGTLDRHSASAKRSPAMDQLAAAKQEKDPATRVTKKAEALKHGLREARAATKSLSQARDALAVENGAPEFTPEAERELEILKATIRRKMRTKAEEEIARAYPEIASGKKRHAPRRNRINI